MARVWGLVCGLTLHQCVSKSACSVLPFAFWVRSCGLSLREQSRCVENCILLFSSASRPLHTHLDLHLPVDGLLPPLFQRRVRLREGLAAEEALMPHDPQPAKVRHAAATRWSRMAAHLAGGQPAGVHALDDRVLDGIDLLGLALSVRAPPASHRAAMSTHHDTPKLARILMNAARTG